MHQKQKINLASRIIARGLLVLNQYFPNPQVHEAFFNAENEGNGKSFLQNKMLHLDEGLRNRLATFYEVSTQLSESTIEKEKEIMTTYISERESLEKSQSRGIISEWYFFDYEYKENPSPNLKKVIALLEKEIILIQQHADTILSLDPDFKLLRQFGEFPEPPNITSDILVETLKEGKVMRLGEMVLRSISPQQNGTLLQIEDEVKPALFQGLQKNIVYWLMRNTELSDKEKEAIGQSQQKFSSYIGTHDEPQYPGFMALAYDQFPDEIKQSSNYIALLWRLGAHYKRMDFKNDYDYEALIRLYDFAVNNYDKVRNTQLEVEMKNDNIFLEIILRRDLAECLEELWNWDKAIQQRVHVAQLALQNNLTVDFEGALFRIISLYKKSFQKALAIEFLVQVLNGNASMIGIVEAFSLSNTTKKAMEIEVIELLETINLSESEKEKYLSNLKTDAGQLLQNVLQNLMLDGNIDSEKITNLKSVYTNFFEDEIPTFFNSHSTANEKANVILDSMVFQDLPIPQYEKAIFEVIKIENEISIENKIVLSLHQAKLRFLKNDPQCIESYRLALLEMESQISLNQMIKENWYNEFIRAHSISPNKNQDYIDQIKKNTLQAVNLIAEGLLNNSEKRTAHVVAMSEIENTFKAISMNVENCKTVVIKQQLLCILWNIIIYRQKFVNKLIGKTANSIAEFSIHQKQYLEIRSLLSKYYFEGVKNLKNEIAIQVNKLRDLEFLTTPSDYKLKEIIIPTHRAILYTFFTKIDTQRVVLMMSFNPGKEENFEYKTYQTFEEMESFLEEFEKEEFYKWKREGLLSVLRDSDLTKEFNQKLTPFFYKSPKLVRQQERLAKFDIFKTEESRISSIEQQNLHIQLFCDNFLHEFPIESLPYLYDENTPIGGHFYLSSILQNSRPSLPINFDNGVALFSGVPEINPFPELLFSIEETAEIERIVKAKKYLTFCFEGQEATRSNFIKVAKQQPAIIHFAVHGIIDPSLPPETSALILTSEGTDKASSILTYQDIICLDLHGVELVVLSSCNSSVGEIKKGASIQGLAYAFLTAGVKFVVASRIETNDKHTAIIMKEFYKNLLETDVAAALSKTRTYFSKQNSPVRKVDIASWGLWS